MHGYNVDTGYNVSLQTTRSQWYSLSLLSRPMSRILDHDFYMTCFSTSPASIVLMNCFVTCVRLKKCNILKLWKSRIIPKPTPGGHSAFPWEVSPVSQFIFKLSETAPFEVEIMTLLNNDKGHHHLLYQTLGYIDQYGYRLIIFSSYSGKCPFQIIYTRRRVRTSYWQRVINCY